MRSIEKVFVNSQDYFTELLNSVANAKKEILIETYIFKKGPITRKLLGLLKEASNRGIIVKIIIDGAGSFSAIEDLRKFCNNSNIQFHVYHPILIRNMLEAFQFINRRNHRKTCIIDSSIVYSGSINLTDDHVLRSWKDYGIYFKGPGVYDLIIAFEKVFNKNIYSKFLKKPLLLKLKNNPHSGVFLNDSFLKRHECRRHLINRIKRSRKRIWIANAYILPEYKIQKHLEAAALRGVDVKILTSFDKNDVFFIPWITRLFYEKSLVSGIKLYEYSPAFFHGKVFVFDDLIHIGSSNLNHRSLFHDLESDIVVTRHKNKQTILKDLQKCFAESIRIQEDNLSKSPILTRIAANILYYFKYWF